MVSGPRLLHIAVILLLIAPGPARGSEPAEPANTSPLEDPHQEDRKGKFVRVVGASSVVVMRFNMEYFFDMLGVDPVISLPGQDGLERRAIAYVDSLLRDQEVVLHLDPLVTPSKVARTHVGYIDLPDGQCLNELILRKGYGKTDDSVPFSRYERFKAAERAAREAKAGLWARQEDARQASVAAPDCDAPGPPYAGTCGAGVPEVVLESKVAPVYPGKARRKKIEGRVVLRTLVAADGTVRDLVAIESPSDLLSEAAIAAVEQWRYQPATRDGSPVDSFLTVVVDFRLAGDR
jgi:TonB family protein